jgi:hypothetical protein
VSARAPAAALGELAASLRADGSVISAHVGEADASAPALGLLAAAGPRAAADPAGYAIVVEAVREGYLLHYADGRVVRGADADLALLAGDYLYALGLERLAALGDLDAVRELSDLISLCAAAHAERAEALTPALWLAAAIAIGCGSSDGHEAAKSAARQLRPDASQALLDEARHSASVTGITQRFEARVVG